VRGVSPNRGESFERWFAALERRHLTKLTFPEIRRALAALSSIYVERRERLESGAALEGEGKRAAFALFYSPLHFLTIREIVRSLGLASPSPRRILDLGCGTGAAGAAWALECPEPPSLLGLDRNGWAVSETRWTYSILGLGGEARKGEGMRARLEGRGEAILVAFMVNELSQSDRERLLSRLLETAPEGKRVLVVEPIARRAFPWWEEWSAAFRSAGGRSDDWRFVVELPETLRLLDRATGMDHRELTARSLLLGDERSATSPIPVRSARFGG
jgi:hypothetical protein